MRDLENEVVVHRREDGFEFLQFRKLLELGVKHAYTLKPHFFNTRPGVVSSETRDRAIRNYVDFCKVIGVECDKLVKPNQTHTNCVKVVDKLPEKMCIEGEEFTDVDGLVTNLNGVSLASCNADCILLLFYDPVKKVIGNVHSGWRGTFAKIAINGVDQMVQSYSCNPEDIIVCICPSIRKCHFEVKEDVKSLCEKTFAYTNRLNEFIDYTGKDDAGVDTWKIDTVMITRILLNECGIKNENIYDCGICSFCNKDIVNSFRGDGKNFGLGTAIISM